MRKAAKWLGIGLLGLALGLGSAAATLAAGHHGSSVSAGPWSTDVSTGSANAGMYTRARIALFGLLALSKKETLYYTALDDDAGALLSGDCTYRLEGADPPARWWSITAYGLDSFLIENDADIYSASKSTVVRGADGRWTVRVSATRQQGSWLPVRAGASFNLTLRLYNPEPSVLAAPSRVALPHIAREACR